MDNFIAYSPKQELQELFQTKRGLYFPHISFPFTLISSVSSKLSESSHSSEQREESSLVDPSCSQKNLIIFFV